MKLVRSSVLYQVEWRLMISIPDEPQALHLYKPLDKIILRVSHCSHTDIVKDCVTISIWDAEVSAIIRHHLEDLTVNFFTGHMDWGTTIFISSVVVDVAVLDQHFGQEWVADCLIQGQSITTLDINIALSHHELEHRQNLIWQRDFVLQERVNC